VQNVPKSTASHKTNRKSLGSPYCMSLTESTKRGQKRRKRKDKKDLRRWAIYSKKTSRGRYNALSYAENVHNTKFTQNCSKTSYSDTFHFQTPRTCRDVSFYPRCSHVVYCDENVMI